MSTTSSIYFARPSGPCGMSRTEELAFFRRIRRGQRATHTLANQGQTMEQAEYEHLVAQVQDGREAEQEVFQRNLGLLFSTTTLYWHRATEIPFDDLLQPGAMALTRAVRRFDPSRSNARFQTYAYRALERAITREMEALQAQGIPTTSHVRALIGDLQWMQTRPTGGGPDPAATLMLGCTAEELAEARQVRDAQNSIPLFDEYLGGASVPDPSALTLQRVWLQGALVQLSPPAQEIVGRSFGLDPYGTSDSPEEIAEALHLPVAEVRQELSTSLHTLRTLLGEPDGSAALAL